MSVLRLCVATLLVFGWLCVDSDVNAQQRPPERGGGFEGPPGSRDGRPDGPPPKIRGKRPPNGGPRGDGPPDGPPHPNGRPPEGPPHGRFGHEHELQRMEELKELDPEMYELEKSDRELDRKTLDLSEQYQRAPKDKREALQKQLAAAVAQHFDVRQARRELHLKRLTEELAKLRESIERRNDVRDQIIGKRVSELVGDEDDLAF
ncbi:MAG: hypothetical protein H8E66_20165 [Planctomycetes bacterium]|nr:hypothetical protein [Planctomycetota bacterium]